MSIRTVLFLIMLIGLNHSKPLEARSENRVSGTGGESTEGDFYLSRPDFNEGYCGSAVVEYVLARLDDSKDLSPTVLNLRHIKYATFTDVREGFESHGYKVKSYKLRLSDANSWSYLKEFIENGTGQMVLLLPMSNFSRSENTAHYFVCKSASSEGVVVTDPVTYLETDIPFSKLGSAVSEIPVLLISNSSQSFINLPLSILQLRLGAILAVTLIFFVMLRVIELPRKENVSIADNQ